MIDLITYIAKSLVEDPTQVKVSHQRRRESINFTLEVAQEDMGRVIGKKGRVANAIRTLLNVPASGIGKKVNLAFCPRSDQQGIVNGDVIGCQNESSPHREMLGTLNGYSEYDLGYDSGQKPAGIVEYLYLHFTSVLNSERTRSTCSSMVQFEVSML